MIFVAGEAVAEPVHAGGQVLAFTHDEIALQHGLVAGTFGLRHDHLDIGHLGTAQVAVDDAEAVDLGLARNSWVLPDELLMPLAQLGVAVVGHKLDHVHALAQLRLQREVERQYRDMRILGIGGGTSEIMTGLAAKTLGYTA